MAQKISTSRIESLLRHEFEVLHYTTIDSTSNACKALLKNGTKKMPLIIADEQTAGRGRQGKGFYSPKDDGLYFSFVLRCEKSIENAVAVTTATSVAVCRAIEHLTDKKPQIKWVNDIYLDGKKICGILVEGIADKDKNIVDSVVVGIGINISTSTFPDSVENGGCLGADVDRNSLISEIVNCLTDIAFSDYSAFIDYYREHSLVIGKDITFIQNGVSTNATALGIDSTGGLIVTLESTEQKILHSGEISVRLL